MRILFFAQLRVVVGVEAAELDAVGVGKDELWELLLRRWPGLSVHRATTRLARNGSYVESGELFEADDEVALIPPVSGG